jgi:hypothetical protein
MWRRSLRWVASRLPPYLRCVDSFLNPYPWLDSDTILGISRKITPCTDGWTSPNVISFISLMVHWAGDGHIQSTILDFVKCIVLISSQLQFHLHNI